jgi:hypothetical protein
MFSSKAQISILSLYAAQPSAMFFTPMPHSVLKEALIPKQRCMH